MRRVVTQKTSVFFSGLLNLRVVFHSPFRRHNKEASREDNQILQIAGRPFLQVTL